VSRGTEELRCEAGADGTGARPFGADTGSPLAAPPMHCPDIVCDPGNQVLGEEHAYQAAWERFRFLEHKLRRVRETRPLQSLLVTSPIPAEGKTVVAINLAITLARNSPGVLLVDGDLRRPGIQRTLALPALPGVAECLEAGADLASAIRLVTPFGFYYLPCGTSRANPLDLLQRPATSALLRRLRGFEWAVVDSPPIEPFADAQCLARHVDGVLLVVRAGVSKRSDLRDALAALDREVTIGLVFNACDNHRHDRYYGRYRTSAKPSPADEGRI